MRFTAAGPLRGVVYCHCSQCRKQSGHFYAATNVADAGLASKAPKTSPGTRVGLCQARLLQDMRLGAVLEAQRSDETSVLAGAFDQPSGLKGEVHIFVGDKGDYYAIDDGLPQFERSTPDDQGRR